MEIIGGEIMLDDKAKETIPSSPCEEGGVFNENGDRLYVSTNQLWSPWDGSELEGTKLKLMDAVG